VTLAAGLAGKATAGETLFIVAKSVDAPLFRRRVRAASAAGPQIHADDSQAMMPGKNCPSARAA